MVSKYSAKKIQNCVYRIELKSQVLRLYAFEASGKRGARSVPLGSLSEFFHNLRDDELVSIPIAVSNISNQAGQHLIAALSSPIYDPSSPSNLQGPALPPEYAGKLVQAYDFLGFGQDFINAWRRRGNVSEAVAILQIPEDTAPATQTNWQVAAVSSLLDVMEKPSTQMPDFLTFRANLCMADRAVLRQAWSARCTINEALSMLELTSGQKNLLAWRKSADEALTSVGYCFIEAASSFIIKSTPVCEVDWLEVMARNKFVSFWAYRDEDSNVWNCDFYCALAYCNALSRREGLLECYNLHDWEKTFVDEAYYHRSTRPKPSLIQEANGYYLPTKAQQVQAAAAGVYESARLEWAWRPQERANDPLYSTITELLNLSMASFRPARSVCKTLDSAAEV